jgi:glycerol-3-phosphate dehydrogenase (NAD(P)+)
MKKVGIIGAGAWGTALACMADRTGCPTTIWARGMAQVEGINQTRISKSLLGVQLSPSIKATSSIEQVLTSDILLLAIPAQQLRMFCLEYLQGKIAKTLPLIICCKGIEQNTALLMSEVLEEVMGKGQSLVILSGPNFAIELARGLPAATTIAANDSAVAQMIMEQLGSDYFRIYAVSDIIAPQIGGAVKNVLAIAAGIVSGKDFGENAKAALLTRGLAEMKRLCSAMGGNTETLLGLSGVGDLILTCTSLKSRNTSLGLKLGRGESLPQILSSHATAEGVATASSLALLATRYSVSMPICSAVNDILYNQVDIDTAISQALLSYTAGDEMR